MPSPFPGMDLYLEDSGLWPDVHHNLISNCQGLLSAQLRLKHIVRVEERTYIADESDPALETQVGVLDLEFEEEIHEAFLKLIDRESRDVDFDVTVIEILSPWNKLPGSAGRESFEKKNRLPYRAPTTPRRGARFLGRSAPESQRPALIGYSSG